MQELAASPLLKDTPWVVMGDFNQVFSTFEAFSLRPGSVLLQEMSLFQGFLSASRLFDLSFRDYFYTWSNKCASNPKARKVDRVLINEMCQDIYPFHNVLFDAPGCSDHSLSLVSLSNSNTRRKTRFNFFVFFTSHPDYQRLLQEA